MPTQVYGCPTEGEFDVTVRITDDVPGSIPCPRCERQSPHVFKPPVVRVKRGWNELANEQRRDPYTQAKAQLTNVSNESQERHDARPATITETSIQAAACAIDHDSRTPVRAAPRLNQRGRAR